jgi:hypothetical protein
MYSINGVKVPILFSKLIKHDEMAQATQPLIVKTFLEKIPNIVSAGEYDPEIGVVYGESVSLKLHHDPDDLEVIKRLS